MGGGARKQSTAEPPSLSRVCPRGSGRAAGRPSSSTRGGQSIGPPVWSLRGKPWVWTLPVFWGLGTLRPLSLRRGETLCRERGAREERHRRNPQKSLPRIPGCPGLRMQVHGHSSFLTGGADTGPTGSPGAGWGRGRGLDPTHRKGGKDRPPQDARAPGSGSASTSTHSPLPAPAEVRQVLCPSRGRALTSKCPSGHRDCNRTGQRPESP